MLLLIGAAGFLSCDKDDDPEPTTGTTIVDILSNDPEYSLLVEAVVKAGLDGLLGAPGQFTVFAPKNDEFQAFLDAAGTGSVANTPANVLADVLTYHVIVAELKSTDLQTGYYETANATFDGNTQVGTDMYFKVDNGVMINGEVSVTAADIDASNGLIHSVSDVITFPTVVTFATADENFTSLVAALTAPGLPTDFVEVLSGDGPFTVFAPTNPAFQALLDSNPDWDSPSDIPTDLLDTVLKYHVSGAGNVRSTDLSDGMMVPTLAGVDFTIDLSDDTPRIIAGSNTANIVVTDVQSKNGVIHVIDAVILP